MDSYTGKLAVVTGGGSGMGRELVRQLAARGCSVAACDWQVGAIEETAALALADTAPDARVTAHVCDVSDESQVLRFRDDLLREHAREHVDVVFSNAGIGGGGSFVNDSREDWERTFAVDWWGVYYCARAFLPLLIASGDGVLVHTSSVNGLWASLGPGMPGHVGTNIIANSRRARGLPEPEQMTDTELFDVMTPHVQSRLMRAGLLADGATPDDMRMMLSQWESDFRDKAPLSAAQAATIILDQVQAGAWRILVGDDATMIDAAVRARPEYAYDYAELFSTVATAATDGNE